MREEGGHRMLWRQVAGGPGAVEDGITRRGIRGLLLAVAAALAVSLLFGCAGAEAPAPTAPPSPVSATPTPRASVPSSAPTPSQAAARAPGSRGRMILTGRIGIVADGGRAITFEEPAHGMSLVALTYQTEIVAADGSPREPEDLQPGMVIRVEGGPSESGTVLATRVRIVSGA